MTLILLTKENINIVLNLILTCCQGDATAKTRGAQHDLHQLRPAGLCRPQQQQLPALLPIGPPGLFSVCLYNTQVRVVRGLQNLLQ